MPDDRRSFSASQRRRKPPKQKQWHEIRDEKKRAKSAAKPAPPTNSTVLVSPLQKRLNAGESQRTAAGAVEVGAMSSGGLNSTMRGVCSREGYMHSSAMSAGVTNLDALALYSSHYHHPVRLPEAKILLSKGTVIDSGKVDVALLSGSLDEASALLMQLAHSERADIRTETLRAETLNSASLVGTGEIQTPGSRIDKIEALQKAVDAIRLQCGALCMAHEEAWGKTSEANQQAYEADLDLESMHGHLAQRSRETEALENLLAQETRTSRNTQLELETSIQKLHIRNSVDLSHVKRSKKDYVKAKQKNTKILMEKLRLEDELKELKSSSRAEITTLKTGIFRANQRAEKAVADGAKGIKEAQREVRAIKRAVAAQIDEASSAVEHKLKARLNELRTDVAIRDAEIRELRETQRELQVQLRSWDANAANEAMKRILHRLSKEKADDGESAALDSVLSQSMDAVEELHAVRARANFAFNEVTRLKKELLEAKAATTKVEPAFEGEPVTMSPSDEADFQAEEPLQSASDELVTRTARPITPPPSSKVREIEEQNKSAATKRRGSAYLANMNLDSLEPPIAEESRDDPSVDDDEEPMDDTSYVSAMLKSLKHDSEYTEKFLQTVEPKVYGQITSESFARACGEEFERVDTDRNGVLTPDEIYPLIASLAGVNDMSVTLQQCREFASIFGEEGSGIVTRLEFVAFCRTILVMQYLHENDEL